jgi:hypothetical protein
MSYPGPQQPPYGQPPYGQPPQPPKPGMSTGKKIGIGCGGCLGLLLFLALLGGCMAMLSGDDTAAAPPAATASPDTEDAAVEEVEEEPAEDASGVVLTATLAGTTGDALDDTVYTVIDVTVENGSEDDLDVNPIYFNVILADGTVISDWADTIFADIDPIDTVTLSPGQRAEGQIAVVGEDLDIETVEMSELFGVQETVTAQVQ